MNITVYCLNRVVFRMFFYSTQYLSYILYTVYATLCRLLLKETGDNIIVAPRCNFCG